MLSLPPREGGCWPARPPEPTAGTQPPKHAAGMWLQGRAASIPGAAKSCLALARESESDRELSDRQGLYQSEGVLTCAGEQNEQLQRALPLY